MGFCRKCHRYGYWVGVVVYKAQDIACFRLIKSGKADSRILNVQNLSYSFAAAMGEEIQAIGLVRKFLCIVLQSFCRIIGKTEAKTVSALLNGRCKAIGINPNTIANGMSTEPIRCRTESSLGKTPMTFERRFSSLFSRSI